MKLRKLAKRIARESICQGCEMVVEWAVSGLLDVMDERIRRKYPDWNRKPEKDQDDK